MSRLIDADALCKLARNSKDGTVDCNDIMRMPFTDAVEVVRCKECKHYVIGQLKYDYTEDKRCKPSVCIRGEFAKHRKPDWFCADGERMVQE